MKNISIVKTGRWTYDISLRGWAAGAFWLGLLGSGVIIGALL